MGIPGIYKANGKLNYTTNLEKKQKKIKGDFEIIKEMPGATLSDLAKEINNKVEEDDDVEVVLHHYVNDKGWSITTIYNNAKYDGFRQID